MKMQTKNAYFFKKKRRPTQQRSQGGARGGYSTPHWHVDQNAKGEKHYVFSSFETVFMHWSGLNSDLKHLLKHIFRGGLICQQQN